MRAVRCGHRPAPRQQEPEATAAVVAACGGLPLAVRIAASRLATRPAAILTAWRVAHLAARLTGERHRLTELSAGDLAVRASFAVSYDTLPERPDGPGEISPRRLFRQLGIPGASELSSAAVAALTGRPAAQVAAVLETLVDAHLLESPAPDRFRLHDLLYEYAAELAGQDGSTGDRDAALGRLHRWYAEQAVMAGQALAPDRKHLVIMAVTAVPVVTVPPQAFCWFETELGNLSMTSQRAPPGRRAGATGPPR